MAVNLVWVTPDCDQLIGYMARVSNPKAKPDDPAERLIAYLILHKHWSPFEMGAACVEINTTRDIARQILRHRSLHFQEFSQRYAEVHQAVPVLRGLRLQDARNRQSSIVVDDPGFEQKWQAAQKVVYETALRTYREFLDYGVAKEVARAVLPEGLTESKMYAQGTIRDWLHYLAIRTGPETQYEHRVIAREIGRCLQQSCPAVFQAATEAGLIGSFNDD